MSYPECKKGSFRARPIYITNSKRTREMVALANRLRLSHVGVNIIRKFEGNVTIANKLFPDISSVVPLIMGVVLVECRDDDKLRQHRFAVDIRKNKVRWCLGALFQISVRFVGHDLKEFLHCLYAMKITPPRMLWDTKISQQCLTMGKKPISEASKNGDNLSDKIYQNRPRYEAIFGGVPLAKTIQEHPISKKFKKKQLQFAIKNAIVAARVYPKQVRLACRDGILHHLETVEMPFIETISRIEWKGAGFNGKRCSKLLKKIRKSLKGLKKKLSDHGVGNLNSNKQLEEFFKKKGILYLFRSHGKYSFNEKLLKSNKEAHLVIPLMIEARKIDSFVRHLSTIERTACSDGRIRPNYAQMGDTSCRITSAKPNIIGMHSGLRHLIIPQEGYGIGEVDWAQFEVGVAGAVFKNKSLVRMFNSGDVYSEMARRFFKGELPNPALKLSDKKFKMKFVSYREKMKICTLGIIYGMTPNGIAEQLSCSIREAEEMYRRFMDMFPHLEETLQTYIEYGSDRGDASTITGLRRYPGNGKDAQDRNENWMINYPIQSTAACVFKKAAVRLDKLYRRYNASIIIPMHDSFVFEAPIKHFEKVAKLTKRIMCETVREFFPELNPRADVNTTHPECWNIRMDSRLS